MVKSSQATIILESRPGVEFENEGVLNPACVDQDGLIHLFYRAVRKGNFSSLGYCQIKDQQIINRASSPLLFPEYPYESHGIEDPRITYLDGKYYLFYTAYDGQNALVAYATSNDLTTFTKQGLISPQITYDEAEDIFRNSALLKKYTFFEKIFRQNHGDNVFLWEKDTLLFPKKINGHYALLHRILPGVQILYFDSFDELTQNFWRQYLHDLANHIVLDPCYPFESDYIGGGCVPLALPQGWLLIGHAAQSTPDGQIYHATATLLAKDNPQKVIGRLPYPLFSPEYDWEKRGVIDNVVFPTSALIHGDLLSIYYGAADTRIARRDFSLSELLRELTL